MKKIGVGYASVTDLEKRYVNEALTSGRLSSGIFVNRFEKAFASKHNKRYGVMCNSGTSALHIALETLKETEHWENGAEVLVPALTFVSSVNAVIHAHLTPVFVDVDSHTYNLSTEYIERHITDKTRAILPVHCFGLPCDMDRIDQISKKHDLKIVEDCSDAHFAAYKGTTVGNWGDISAFSTYVAHTITTGVGGITITNNAHVAEILRSLIAHGRSCTCEACVAANSDQVCRKRSASELDRRFCFERLGYSYRVGEIEGALGLAQLERCGEIMDRRRSNAKRLTELLSSYQDDLQLPVYGPEYDHTFMMYPIMIKSERFSRREITDFLEARNIETRPLFPLLNQPLYKRMYGDIEDEYPVAKNISRKGFYVGCHHGLGANALRYIGDVFKEFMDSGKRSKVSRA